MNVPCVLITGFERSRRQSVFSWCISGSARAGSLKDIASPAQSCPCPSRTHPPTCCAGPGRPSPGTGDCTRRGQADRRTSRWSAWPSISSTPASPTIAVCSRWTPRCWTMAGAYFSVSRSRRCMPACGNRRCQSPVTERRRLRLQPGFSIGLRTCLRLNIRRCVVDSSMCLG